MQARRQSGQTIREFNSAVDQDSRLLEIGCKLPDVARAWAYLINELSLSSSEELSLLASAGNEYNTTQLQRAAVLHEKTLRPPWQSRKGLLPATESDGKGSKGVRATYLTGVEDDEEHEELPHEDDEGIPEEEAAEIHEAYVAQETAKARFREVAKARVVDPACYVTLRRPPSMTP